MQPYVYNVKDKVDMNFTIVKQLVFLLAIQGVFSDDNVKVRKMLSQNCNVKKISNNLFITHNRMFYFSLLCIYDVERKEIWKLRSN